MARKEWLQPHFWYCATCPWPASTAWGAAVAVGVVVITFAQTHVAMAEAMTVADYVDQIQGDQIRGDQIQGDQIQGAPLVASG